MAKVLITPPAVEPISLDDARLHVRQDDRADDALITGLIKAAREYVETTFVHRALITQTWELVLDDWPDGYEIELPMPPLQTVTSVKYTDLDGVEHTFDDDYYIVDTTGVKGRIVLVEDADWPSSEDLQEAAAIRVRFVAGYGATGASVPETLILGMKMLIGSWYENREPSGSLEVADLLMWASEGVVALIPGPSPERKGEGESGMEAGKLRHRITIKRKLVTRDSFGEETVTLSAGDAVWASVEPMRGQEFIEAQKAGVNGGYADPHPLPSRAERPTWW